MLYTSQTECLKLFTCIKHTPDKCWMGDGENQAKRLGEPSLNVLFTISVELGPYFSLQVKFELCPLGLILKCYFKTPF